MNTFGKGYIEMQDMRWQQDCIGTVFEKKTGTLVVFAITLLVMIRFQYFLAVW